MTESFVERWREIIARPDSGKFEVDAEHPLRFIVGVNDQDQPLIFVIVHDKPPMPDLSGVISVERRQRVSDDSWTLGLALTDSRFLEAFLQFAEDLVVRTENAQGERDGVILLLKVVSEWKRLLARGARSPLSEQALRGLVAELWFGFRMLPREAALPKIALAWQGPHGGHQDYVFPLGPRYEVKSRHVDSETIRISSPEQLDAENLSLVTVTLVEVEPGEPDVINLPTIVVAIRAQLAPAPDALLAFDQALDALGVDPEDSAYVDHWFVVTECLEYGAGADFPAIRRSDLPGSIVAATYDIMISEIENFVRVRWEAQATG